MSKELKQWSGLAIVLIAITAAVMVGGGAAWFIFIGGLLFGGGLASGAFNGKEQQEQSH